MSSNLLCGPGCPSVPDLLLSLPSKWYDCLQLWATTPSNTVYSNIEYGQNLKDTKQISARTQELFRKEHTFQQESNQSQSTKDRQSKESNVLGLKGKRKLFKNQNKKLRAFRYQRQVLRAGDCSVVEVLTTKPYGPSRSPRRTSESCPLSSVGMLWHTCGCMHTSNGNIV